MMRFLTLNGGLLMSCQMKWRYLGALLLFEALETGEFLTRCCTCYFMNIPGDIVCMTAISWNRREV